MPDPKKPRGKSAPKRITSAPPPIPYLSGGGGYTPAGRPKLRPAGYLWLPDVIKRYEVTQQLFYDGDMEGVWRDRHGELHPIRSERWSNDQFWDRARRTGHIAGSIAQENPVFVREKVAGAAGDRRREAEQWVREHPPKLRSRRPPLDKDRPTLCEAVTWLAIGRPYASVQYQDLPDRPDRRSNVRVWARFTSAEQTLIEAIAGRRVRAYYIDGKPIPVKWFKPHSTQLQPQMDLAGNTLFNMDQDSHETKRRTRYENVTINGADLERVWPLRSEAVRKTAPDQLTQEASRRGGQQPKYDKALQDAINRIEDELAASKKKLTPGTLKKWVRDHGSYEEPYSFEDPIPNCDDLYIDGNKLVWKDRDGRECHMALKSLERYISRANHRS